MQALLEEERKVNMMVKQALDLKRQKLSGITEFTERAVAKERRDLQVELEQKIAQVSVLANLRTGSLRSLEREL